MDPPSVRTPTFNNFLWNFFQTLTICSILLMVLSIYYAFFASLGGNILVPSAIIVAFAMTSHIFIIPNLPQIAAATIPIIGLNKNVTIRSLKVVVWMFCGYICPFVIHLSCSSLMAGIGLLKLYGDGGSACRRVMDVITVDVVGPCVYVFHMEQKHGTGRWVDSSSGWAMFGLFIVGYMAYYLPPLVIPEKKKMNPTAAVSIPYEKKKMNVGAEAAATLGSGTQTSEAE